MSEKERLDVIVRLRFYSTAEGGRKGPTPERIFKCIFVFRSENFDCALMLEGIGSVHPGQTVTVPIVFLCPDLLEGRLHPGDTIHLREARIIAVGEVESVLLPMKEFNSLPESE